MPQTERIYNIRGNNYSFIVQEPSWGGYADRKAVIYLIKDMDTPNVETVDKAEWNEKRQAYTLILRGKKIYRKTPACIQFYMLTKVWEEVK